MLPSLLLALSLGLAVQGAFHAKAEARAIERPAYPTKAGSANLPKNIFVRELPGAVPRDIEIPFVIEMKSMQFVLRPKDILIGRRYGETIEDRMRFVPIWGEIGWDRTTSKNVGADTRNDSHSLPVVRRANLNLGHWPKWVRSVTSNLFEGDLDEDPGPLRTLDAFGLGECGISRLLRNLAGGSGFRPEFFGGVFQAASGSPQSEGEKSQEQGAKAEHRTFVVVKGVKDLDEEEREAFVMGAILCVLVLVFLANLALWLTEKYPGKKKD